MTSEAGRSMFEVLAQPVEHVVAGLPLGLRERAERGGAVGVALAARLPLVDREARAELKLRGQDAEKVPQGRVRRLGPAQIGQAARRLALRGLADHDAQLCGVVALAPGKPLPSEGGSLCRLPGASRVSRGGEN